MAESKRNMKIDTRLRVIGRVMRLELLIFMFSVSAIIGLPLYFLKIKPYRERIHEEQQKLFSE